MFKFLKRRPQASFDDLKELGSGVVESIVAIQGQIAGIHVLLSCIVDFLGRSERDKLIEALKQTLAKRIDSHPEGTSEEHAQIYNNMLTHSIMTFIEAAEEEVPHSN